MSSADFAMAGMTDIPFLVETVLEAERSGTERIGLARVFGIKEEELPALVRSMFLAEVGGCEFSVSSFRVARENGVAIAAVAGWIEGMAEDGIPSQLLRSNLIGFTFPKEAMAVLRTHAKALADMRLDRDTGKLQIEYLHVAPEHRRKGLAAQLIRLHIQQATAAKARPTAVQLQVYANNLPAITLYRSLGFRTVKRSRSDHPGIQQLLPFHEKLVMEREL